MSAYLPGSWEYENRMLTRVQAGRDELRAEVERLKRKYTELKDATWAVPGEPKLPNDNMTHAETLSQAVDQATAYEKLDEQVNCETNARLYYQDIIYHVCNVLDKLLGRSLSRGEGTVCGTLETPSRGVQEAMDVLAERHTELRGLLRGLYQAVLEVDEQEHYDAVRAHFIKEEERRSKQ